MSKIAVIGLTAYNAVIDCDVISGGYSLGKDYCFEIGGSGVTAAKALKKLGAEVSLLSAVGDDAAAKQCYAALESDGIDANLVVKPAAKTAFCVTMDGTKRSGAIYTGAELKPLDLQIFEDNIRNANVLLVFSDVPEAVADAAYRMAKKYGVRTVYACSGYIKPSLAMLSGAGTVLVGESDKAYYGDRYCKKAVALRDGCGVSFRDGKDAFFAPSMSETCKSAKNTLEAFCAGYCYKISIDGSFTEAAYYARACAAFASKNGKGEFADRKTADKLFETLKK